MLDKSVKYRLWLTMALMVLLVVVGGAVGFWALSHEVAGVNLSIQEGLAFVGLANQLKIDLLQLRRFEKDYFLSIGNPEEQKDYLKKHQAIAVAVPGLISRLAGMARAAPGLPPQLKDKAAALAANFGDYQAGFSQVLKQVVTDPRLTPAQANALMVSHKDNIAVLERDLAVLDEAGREMLAGVMATVIRQGEAAKVLIVAVVAAAALLILLLGTLLSHAIRRAVFREGFRRLGGI